jgi:hypothetical protein
LLHGRSTVAGKKGRRESRPPGSNIYGGYYAIATGQLFRAIAGGVGFYFLGTGLFVT